MEGSSSSRDTEQIKKKMANGRHPNHANRTTTKAHLNLPNALRKEQGLLPTADGTKSALQLPVIIHSVLWNLTVPFDSTGRSRNSSHEVSSNHFLN